MTSKIAHRIDLHKARRWVIKIGSSLITDPQHGLNHNRIREWAEQISTLKDQQKQVVLVSSGAVSEGIYRLGWSRRPHHRHQIQAAAAIGQMGLVHAYETYFQTRGLCTAQVLLTHEDVTSRTRYLNARATLNALLELQAIPVVNENDTVATEEIQLGDNDTLAARVANLIDADVLLILTDQDGLYAKDPKQHSDAEMIATAVVTDPGLDTAAGPSVSALGRGGMITKIAAARQAAISGTTTVIAQGGEEAIITRIAAGEILGTWLRTEHYPLAARKQWIIGLKAAGTLLLDDGACRALAQGSSLLPVGVVSVAGKFERGDAVECRDSNGRVVARGLSNYSHEEAGSIIGMHSKEVRKLMKNAYESELIHRDNLAVID